MEMAAKRILAVDDDPSMLALIADYLGDNGLRVNTATNGQAMARLLAESVIDLIVLDLKLAGEDGLTLARELRTTSDVPIIIVTGQRCDTVDRIIGLELGADDYLTKPFAPRELLARINAVLRRAAGRNAPVDKNDKRRAYRFAGWELNLRTRRLTSPASVVVPLTSGEFNLLSAFLRAPQQVLSRDQLLAYSRLHDDEVYDRSIDVQILRLRRKLEINPSEPHLIKTERSMGYTFTAPVEAL